MSWDPIRNPVNKFKLANNWSPGVCVGPVGASIARAIDERRGYGIDFAFVVFFGRKLAHFKTNLILASVQDWEDWQTWRVLINTVPRRGAVNSASSTNYDPALAMTIWHPQLVPLGITSCMVENEPQEEPAGTKGVYIVPIEFVQIVTKPRAASAKLEASQDSPLDPLDKRIKDLTDQLLDPGQVGKLAPSAPGAPR